MRPRKVESHCSFTSLLKAALGGNSNVLPFLFAAEMSPSKPSTPLPFWILKPEVMPTMPPLRLVRGARSAPVALSRNTALPHAPPPATPAYEPAQVATAEGAL